MISTRPSTLRTRRRAAAFTLAEMMIATTLSGVLAGIIYLVAGESLASFARNVSINRSYSDARLALDRIAVKVASAGHIPVLVDTNGALTTVSPAAGVRFYRANPQSNYKITAGSSSATSANNTLTIQLGTGQTAPTAKDLLTIPTWGYQGTVSSVSTGGSSCTVTMTGTLASGCSPSLTAPVDFTNPQQYTQDYTQVAYIVVGNQLRYYPLARSVATDTAAVFNSPANFQVLVNLVSAANNSSGAAATPLLPFSIVNSPTVTVQLYAENPDYNNRSTAIYNSINSVNTYTYMQSSLGSRCPVTLRGPF